MWLKQNNNVFLFLQEMAWKRLFLLLNCQLYWWFQLTTRKLVIMFDLEEMICLKKGSGEPNNHKIVVIWSHISTPFYSAIARIWNLRVHTEPWSTACKLQWHRVHELPGWHLRQGVYDTVSAVADNLVSWCEEGRGGVQSTSNYWLWKRTI